MTEKKDKEKTTSTFINLLRSTQAQRKRRLTKYEPEYYKGEPWFFKLMDSDEIKKADSYYKKYFSKKDNKFMLACIVCVAARNEDGTEAAALTVQNVEVIAQEPDTHLVAMVGKIFSFANVPGNPVEAIEKRVEKTMFE